MHVGVARESTGVEGRLCTAVTHKQNRPWWSLYMLCEDELCARLLEYSTLMQYWGFEEGASWVVSKEASGKLSWWLIDAQARGAQRVEYAAGLY